MDFGAFREGVPTVLLGRAKVNQIGVAARRLQSYTIRVSWGWCQTLEYGRRDYGMG